MSKQLLVVTQEATEAASLGPEFHHSWPQSVLQDVGKPSAPGSVLVCVTCSGVLLLSLLPTCPLKSVKCPCKYNTNPDNLALNIWAVLMKNLTSVLQTDYYGWSWRSLLCPGWDVLDTHKNASVRCPCWEWFPIVVWVRNVPDSLGYLNSWSPFFGHVWEVWVVQPSRRKFNTAQALILKALCHF